MSTSITADSPLSVVMVTKVTIICVTHACLGGFYSADGVFLRMSVVCTHKNQFPPQHRRDAEGET